MSLKWLILIFGSVVFAHPSSAETCGLKRDPLQNISNSTKIIESYEESPFLMACKNPPDLLKNRPKPGFFSRAVIEKDLQGRTTRDLLRKVLEKVKKRIAEASFQITELKRCLAPSAPQCEVVHYWLQHELPQFVENARYNLSLSQSPHQIRSWLKMTSHKVNSALDSLGSYKFNNWSPLTKRELEVSEKQLSAYKLDILIVANKEVLADRLSPNCVKLNPIRDEPRCVDEFLNDSLFAARHQHYQLYLQILQQVPLLQYLRGPSVSTNELQSAFSEMSSNLNKESEQLNHYENLLGKTGPLSPEVLKILNYNANLEEVLLEDNRDCGLATALHLTSNHRETVNTIAVGLPILAASLFAGPVVVALGGSAAMGAFAGAATGAAVGSAFAKFSYNEFRETQRRTLGYIYGTSGDQDPALNTDYPDLERTAKELKYSVATLPVGIGLGSSATRTLSVGKKALNTAKTLFSRQSK